ncbi:winged helix-turn-helix transcriptional regulator, partial [Staphylococcus aureus]|uniref:winged helix-turn-helix transcriptional regulator n=1 Tax=Staphylococcus aureus TaxID=1280 RepID=UPI0039BDC6DC
MSRGSRPAFSSRLDAERYAPESYPTAAARLLHGYCTPKNLCLPRRRDAEPDPRQLEADGLICRAVRDGRGQRMDYRLTGFGRSLRPALNALAAWGKDHHHALGAEYENPVNEA